MKLILMILPTITAILAMLTKQKIVNTQNSERAAIQEFVIDICRFCVIALVLYIGNISAIDSKSMWPLLIDASMLIVYVLPFLQKNYNYAERKAYIAIMASIFSMIIIVIVILQMILGRYDQKNLALVNCFFKTICYFFMGVFASLTSRKDSKLRVFFQELILCFKNYQPTRLDYFTVAFCGLFVFNGCIGYYPPIPVFGMQEILKKRYFRAFVFMFMGILVICFKNTHPLLFELLSNVYSAIALLYLLRQFSVSKKASTKV